MNASEIMTKMIYYLDGNIRDINHFLKVFAYARAIGKGEKIEKETQEQLEVAAIIHDIACPLCREKYGSIDGKYQEMEGTILAEVFLRDTGYSETFIQRVAFLVGHHHTLNQIKGIDYQILIEADYLVNADESGYTKQNIRNTMENVFKTETGISLLKSIYKVE